MFGRSVKRECLIVVRAAFRGVSRGQQGGAHKAMPDDQRSRRSLLLRERQELSRKLTHDVAIECHKAHDPQAIET